MIISPVKLSIASASAFILLWIVCSLLVHLFPVFMVNISGHMVHMDLSEFTWTLTWSGLLQGLFAWAFIAAITAWLIAMIYNLFSARN